jgi:hypothetical protein
MRSRSNNFRGYSVQRLCLLCLGGEANSLRKTIATESQRGLGPQPNGKDVRVETRANYTRRCWQVLAQG